jgi:hypothetical protein
LVRKAVEVLEAIEAVVNLNQKAPLSPCLFVTLLPSPHASLMMDFSPKKTRMTPGFDFSLCSESENYLTVILFGGAQYNRKIKDSNRVCNLSPEIFLKSTRIIGEP